MRPTRRRSLSTEPTRIMKNFYRRAAGAAVVLGVALLAACETPSTPPQFEIEGTGAVEGRLFLDEIRDGFYDPAGGDQPLAGVQVVLRDRGTTQVLAGPVTTDEGGQFSFGEVRPGTHDLFVIYDADDDPLPFDAVVCQNPLPVSVYRGEPAAVPVAARDACLITIAEARELGVGEFVNIRGVVTSYPGQVQSSYVYIQDATGGIQFFTSALNDAGLEIGDLIDVSGVLDEFANTLQLTNVQLNEVEPGVGAPAPRPTTTAEIAAEAWDPSGALQGMLVVVRGAELQSPFDSGGNRNARIDDGSGPGLLRVASGISGSGDAILTNLGLTVGACYDIVGLAGGFGSDGQLFLRSADDIEEVPCD
jgi:hypothetical protein